MYKTKLVTQFRDECLFKCNTCLARCRWLGMKRLSFLDIPVLYTLQCQQGEVELVGTRKWRLIRWWNAACSIPVSKFKESCKSLTRRALGRCPRVSRSRLEPSHVGNIVRMFECNLLNCSGEFFEVLTMWSRYQIEFQLDFSYWERHGVLGVLNDLQYCSRHCTSISRYR